MIFYSFLLILIMVSIDYIYTFNRIPVIISNHHKSYNQHKDALNININCIRKQSYVLCNANSKVEDGIDLTDLDNFILDGNYLKNSIIKWLDYEYIVQPIHIDIGIEVEKIYIRERLLGVKDLGEMLMQVGTYLESFNMDNAFVNAWDIANKVSDFLMIRLNRELCSCSGDLKEFIEDSNNLVKNALNDIPISKNTIPTNEYYLNNESILYKAMNNIKSTKTISRLLTSEFARFKLLAEFLDGDIPQDDMYIIVGLMMGFRIKSNNKLEVFQQDSLLAPYRWDSLQEVPDIYNIEDYALQKKLFADLPEDEDATDMVMETVAGIEMYSLLKKSENIELQRKILIAKWLYIQGFLNNIFPPTERFIPYHLLDEIED